MEQKNIQEQLASQEFELEFEVEAEANTCGSCTSPRQDVGH
ncbi:hypothetical protein [Vibrio sp. 10N.261.52.A1]|nr:hypothetical protein [Vibrio sp. 10N.261.52.A1]EDK28755.1 hypothetical protein VSWAT3_16305 [Vibrionales bacterium SWAT-3]